jgi:hypothetical protein
MKADWQACLDNKVGFKGFAIPKDQQDKVAKFTFNGQPAELRHGSVVIAAITSCTNTSNPSVMLGAGLVAKKATELGLEVKPWIKTSLAPGSGAVTLYLEKRYAAQLRRISDGISCLLFLQMRAEYDLPTPYVFLAVCDVMLLDGLKPKHFVFHLQW